MPISNQAVTPGRTTLLEAVNTLLAVIGEQPVNTLETQQIVEASMAERTLLEFHKEGQVNGWSWNSVFAWSLYRLRDLGRPEPPKKAGLPEPPFLAGGVF